MNFRFRFVWLFLNMTKRGTGVQTIKIQWGKWRLIFVMLWAVGTSPQPCIEIQLCSRWTYARARGQCLCAGRHESAVSLWTDGWIITKKTHKLLAFRRQWLEQRDRKCYDDWTACNYHGSLPRLDSTGRSRSPPHKQVQQQCYNVLEFVTLAASSPLSEASRLWVHSMPQWLIALEEQGPAKPRGSSAVLQSEGGKHKDSVEALRMGETSRIWKQGLFWCQQHIKTHLTAGGDPPLSFYPRFHLSNNTLAPHCNIGAFWRGKKESLHVMNHAGWTPCKIDAPACKTPQLYKFALCICNAVYSSTFMCGCLPTLHSWCFREMKRSLSLPFIWYRRWSEY